MGKGADGCHTGVPMVPLDSAPADQTLRRQRLRELVGNWRIVNVFGDQHRLLVSLGQTVDDATPLGRYAYLSDILEGGQTQALVADELEELQRRMAEDAQELEEYEQALEQVDDEEDAAEDLLEPEVPLAIYDLDNGQVLFGDGGLPWPPRPNGSGLSRF